jgi:GNAT superfamily N-acetyltransferase
MCRSVSCVVLGYRRPDRPRTLVVRELVVDRGARGRGLGSAMLDALVDVVPDLDHVESVITPDHKRAVALYTGLARRWRAPIRRSELPHRSREIVCRVGPILRWADGGTCGEAHPAGDLSHS